jgi:phage tail sheath protein FI
MAVQVSYPGVYIEEFAPGAPIQGVSTNIAGFVGVARSGDLDEPTKITTFDRFKATFGAQPRNGFYLWHAVRGFFDNGGTACYVVRASNGAYATADLVNGAGQNLVRARARQPGNPAAAIDVQVTRTNLISNVPIYQPTGTATAISGSQVTMTDADEAARFRPGDVLDFGAARATVSRVSASTIYLTTALSGVAVPANVRLADLAVGATIVRLQPAAPLASGALISGTVLTLTQGANTSTDVVEAVQTEYFQQAGAQAVTYRVTLRLGLTAAIDMTQAATVQSEEVDIQTGQGAPSGQHQGLGLDPAHTKYYLTYINANDALVRLDLIEPPPTAQLPGGLLATQGPTALAGGADEDLATLTDQDYIDAVETLAQVDEVSLVAVPGVTALPVQQAVIAHCERLADRFAVLDAPNGAGMFGANSVEAFRRSVDSARGYSALYYPWLRVLSAATGKEIVAPPSGHICGIMARVDNNRGVHKAPANEFVDGAFGVQTTMSNEEQGLLNLAGINVIRVFQAGGRPRVWGARTTATDLNWLYVNVRRLFLYLEESIQEGINWAVFEPNNLELWQKLKRTITEFLTRVWNDGGLFGASAEEAFYVKIDEELNPFSEQRLGRLNIEIGVRPTYPAEFIIVRIGIWPGGAEVSEG